jgi:hypothetical protein
MKQRTENYEVNDVTILIVLQHISRYGIYCNAECLFLATDIPMSLLSHPFIVKDDGQKTINQILVNIFLEVRELVFV